MLRMIQSSFHGLYNLTPTFALMEGWDTAKAVQAQGIHQLGCIKCRQVFGPEEFVSMNGRQFCKMCSACRKTHRDADRVYKRQRREREHHENMLALATRYEKFFRGTHSLGTSDTGSPPLHRHDASYLTPVNELRSIETSTKMEIDSDTSIRSNVSEMEDTPIDSEDSKVELQIIPYQFCLSCGTPRNFNLVYSGICVYCMEEKKYCIYGDHEEDRLDFVDKHGDEHVRCNNCRGDELTGSAESSCETEVKHNNDQLRADKSQMEIDPKVDHNSEADDKRELEVQSELGIEARMDVNLHVDIHSQTNIKSQRDEQHLLSDDLPLDDNLPHDDNLPQDDESQHYDALPQDDDLLLDDELLSDTESSTRNELNFSVYETEQVENEPAIQVSNVKPESMASIDLNSIPRFQSSSVQGMGNFLNPIVIDSD